MFKYYYVIFLAAMFWMASAASAQQLPANASGAPLNVAVTQAYGDLNHDGEVNLADINILVNMMLARTEQDQSGADIDHNGSVDVADINTLINIMLGIGTF